MIEVFQTGLCGPQTAQQSLNKSKVYSNTLLLTCLNLSFRPTYNMLVKRTNDKKPTYNQAITQMVQDFYHKAA